MRRLKKNRLADAVKRGIAHMQSQMLFADVMREFAELTQAKREGEPPPEPEPAPIAE